jgi:hypothetical protein
MFADLSSNFVSCCHRALVTVSCALLTSSGVPWEAETDRTRGRIGPTAREDPRLVWKSTPSGAHAFDFLLATDDVVICFK